MVIMTLGFVAGVLLLTAIEGALCLLMATPLALGIGIMGAEIGRNIARRDPGPTRHAAFALLLLPGVATANADRVPTPLREVRSAIVISAPPEVVWQNVIALPPLPLPSELVFRAGIAYPVQARIEGRGVGAVRFCEFSTGAFIEPITRWEPARRLAFDVVAQPSPLTEWSPYAGVAPPHLDGYINARRGEFRLIPLPDGRTRLEGSTWYELEIFPAGYWAIFGDAFIGRIHGRVLRHIQRVSEGAADDDVRAP